MRYWGSSREGTRAPARPVSRRRSRAAVVSGGSAGPFLRRFYRPAPALSDALLRIVLLLAAAGLIYAFVLGDGGLVRLAMLRAERDRAARRVVRLERVRDRLSEAAQALAADPLAIEKVGRERYGMIRPGETVVRFLPPRRPDDGRPDEGRSR